MEKQIVDGPLNQKIDSTDNDQIRISRKRKASTTNEGSEAEEDSPIGSNEEKNSKKSRTGDLLGGILKEKRYYHTILDILNHGNGKGKTWKEISDVMAAIYNRPDLDLTFSKRLAEANLQKMIKSNCIDAIKENEEEVYIITDTGEKLRLKVQRFAKEYSRLGPEEMVKYIKRYEILQLSLKSLHRLGEAATSKKVYSFIQETEGFAPLNVLSLNLFFLIDLIEHSLQIAENRKVVERVGTNKYRLLLPVDNPNEVSEELNDAKSSNSKFYYQILPWKQTNLIYKVIERFQISLIEFLF